MGAINKIGKYMVHFQISNLKELALIIEHFNKYPLLSYKAVDYNLFKQAFYLISAKEHLTSEGLIKLLSLKASLNKGVNDKFNEIYPNIEPAKLTINFNTIELINPE